VAPIRPGSPDQHDDQLGGLVAPVATRGGLQVPTKTKKKRLTGVGTHVGAMSLIAPNALWALDFQFDHTIDCRQVKMLNVIDEFTASASTSASITPSPLTTSLPCWTVSRSSVAARRRSSGSTTAPSSSFPTDKPCRFH
jgi:hypothetical protein